MQLNPFHRENRVKYARNPINTFLHSRGGGGGTKNVLVYLGVHKADSFIKIFGQYQTCYAFEANPILYAKLKRRFRYYKRVHIFNYAVTDTDGDVAFHISNEISASSLAGGYAKDAPSHWKMEKTVTVPSVHLGNFMRRLGVTQIDDYISDIQGFDLAALKTMKAYIRAKKIGTIQCEVSGEKQLYADSPDNSIAGFTALLGGKYKLVAKSPPLAHNQVLKPGEFREVGADQYDMDCMWVVK